MVKVLPMVPSSEGRENFLEAVPVIAEIPLALSSSEGRGKLGTTRTTVWFTVEYCHTDLLKNVRRHGGRCDKDQDMAWHKHS